MSQVHEPDGYYGWVVALVGAVALIFTLGTPFSYGIFVDSLSTQYTLSEFSVSIIFAIHLFASYSFAGIISVFATRFPTKRVFGVIGAVTLLLAPSLYLTESIVGLLVVFTVLGTALGVTVILLISVVPQWFDTHRGLATGVLFVGIGLSLFVMPPAWNLAFSTVGVPGGFLVIISLSALSFFGAGAICHHPPWLPRTIVPIRELETWIRELVRTRRFQYLLLGFGLAFTWFYLLAGFGVDYLEYRGLDRAVASFAFGLIGGISIFSRLASGAVADKLGYGRTYLLSLGCAMVGCILLVLPGFVSLYLAILFLGISLGGVTTLFVPIVLGIYDPDKSTAIVGVFSIGLGLTAVAAPPVATILVSITESFLYVILLTMSTVLVAILLIWLGTDSE